MRSFLVRSCLHPEAAEQVETTVTLTNWCGWRSGPQAWCALCRNRPSPPLALLPMQLSKRKAMCCVRPRRKRFAVE
eukprot:1147927-Pelagomonas_calceolata.AAC.7